MIIFFPYKECWMNTLVKCSSRCVCVCISMSIYLGQEFYLLVSYILISLCVYKARNWILAYSVCTHLTLLFNAKLFFKLCCTNLGYFLLPLLPNAASFLIILFFFWIDLHMCFVYFYPSRLKILYTLPPSIDLNFHFLFYIFQWTEF